MTVLKERIIYLPEKKQWWITYKGDKPVYGPYETEWKAIRAKGRLKHIDRFIEELERLGPMHPLPGSKYVTGRKTTSGS